MSVTKLPGRQEVIQAEPVTITYADLVSGVASEVFDLPANARVVGGRISVTEVFDSATSDVLDIGDGDDDDRYTSSQVDLTALGVTEFDATFYTYTAKDTIDAIWTGVGAAPTQGSFTVDVRYVKAGREAFTQD